MIPVIVRRLAEADIERAKTWYERKDSRLATRFAEEIDATVDRISTLPDQFPDVGNGVRRALLHQFPYSAYFVRRESIAIVIAVLHQHRRPGGWKHRANLETAG
jgi:plasmid stabilization system protein ParE